MARLAGFQFSPNCSYGLTAGKSPKWGMRIDYPDSTNDLIVPAVNSPPHIWKGQARMTPSKFNLRNVFLVNAIVDLAFALGLLIGPDTILRLYGLSTNKTELLLARFYGGSMATLAMLAWFARDFVDRKARDAAATALFFGALVGLIVALLATLGNVLRDGGWPTVLVFLAFAGSYGYLLFAKPTD